MGVPARDPRTRARLLALACLAFFLVGGVGRLALGDALTSWDQAQLERLAAIRTPAITATMRVLSTIGAGEVAIPIGLLVVWLLVRRRERAAARCYAATTLSGWALNFGLKVLFERPRPSILPHLDRAGGYSYPSGHAMLAPLVFGLGAFLLSRSFPAATRRVVRAAAALLAIGIGLSRAWLAVHYPSDVAAALLAGTGWSALGVAAAGPLDPDPAPPNVSADTAAGPAH